MLVGGKLIEPRRQQVLQGRRQLNAGDRAGEAQRHFGEFLDEERNAISPLQDLVDRCGLQIFAAQAGFAAQ